MNSPATHLATTPNKNAPLQVEDLRNALQKDYQKQITNYFNGDKEKAMKFMSAVIHSVQKVPELLACEKSTLLNAFMACAEYELFPSSVSGEAYVLPYKGKAQFQLGYQGIITLLYRAGVGSVHTGIVYEKDFFEYEEGLNPKLVHRPDVFGGDRGKPKGVYAVASVNGDRIFKVMSVEEVMKFKEFSQAKNSDYSPWNSSKDPELWMWRKTCIKQLAKVLPKNETIQKAIAKDNEESNIVRDDRNSEGPATGRALHVPAQAEESKSQEGGK